MSDKPKVCPKCGYGSGNDWRQCKQDCPMPMSPHYRADKPFTHFWINPARMGFRALNSGYLSCFFCGCVKPRDKEDTNGCPGRVRVTLRAV